MSGFCAGWRVRIALAELFGRTELTYLQGIVLAGSTEMAASEWETELARMAGYDEN
jgi:hypothetical protein